MWLSMNKLGIKNYQNYYLKLNWDNFVVNLFLRVFRLTYNGLGYERKSLTILVVCGNISFISVLSIILHCDWYTFSNRRKKRKEKVQLCYLHTDAKRSMKIFYLQKAWMNYLKKNFYLHQIYWSVSLNW